MPKMHEDRRNLISRRCVLQALGWTGIGGMLGSANLFPALATFSSGDVEPAFESIPASTSGISWVHSSGLSPEMWLPETLGAGGAFLDYDNDGWMDIYLINSGRCDFWTPSPPLRNALYHNNRDGTFTDITMKAGVPGDAYGMG
ncbi:MAG TPA: VCBS repeat-containing protein, partial [Candidatus Sulfotelmatobacter sp.]|nr:VCBS repeat-containing protein [Candidatus Sulfotelmatobacter sp.]